MGLDNTKWVESSRVSSNIHVHVLKENHVFCYTYVSNVSKMSGSGSELTPSAINLTGLLT